MFTKKKFCDFSREDKLTAVHLYIFIQNIANYGGAMFVSDKGISLKFCKIKIKTKKKQKIAHLFI